MDTKLIFVTGGVVSSLGKGITAAALGIEKAHHLLHTTYVKRGIVDDPRKK